MGSSGTKNLPVLDGLRGVAALSVVLFHLQEGTVGITSEDSFWMRHAYFAVDFFFCLSGFVIGHAYDDRQKQIGFVGFAKARLIRLHPMVIFGVLLGFLSYIFDPFTGVSRSIPWMELQAASGWKLFVCILCGLLLMPVSSLPNRFDNFMPLNVPSWSLMWEYVANIAYALVLWRLSIRMLAGITLLSGIGVLLCAHQANTLALGSAWGQMMDGFARVAFSFCAGLLLVRIRFNLKAPIGFGLLSLALVLLFALPGHGNPEMGKMPFNWLYDSFCVVVAFPLIVLLGSSADASGFSGAVCQFSGRISYPIYMVHYSVVMIFVNYEWSHHLSGTLLPWVIDAVTILAALASYAILVLFDEPVRRALRAKFLARTIAPCSPGSMSEATLFDSHGRNEGTG